MFFWLLLLIIGQASKLLHPPGTTGNFWDHNDCPSTERRKREALRTLQTVNKQNSFSINNVLVLSPPVIKTIFKVNYGEARSTTSWKKTSKSFRKTSVFYPLIPRVNRICLAFAECNILLETILPLSHASVKRVRLRKYGVSE